MIVATKVWISLLMAALIESVTGGDFNGPLIGTHIMLFKGTPDLGPNLTLAGLTEATYDGYARIALTWGSVLQEPDGSAKLVSSLANFRATDGTISEVLTGYAILDATTPTPQVLMAEMFPSPLPITMAADGVSIVGQVDYSGEDLSGAAFIF